jgi:vacuolar protein sorting-associated protein 13A/C
MPQTFSASKSKEAANNEITYDLEPDDRVEVFTPGPSIAITVRPRDNPVAGNELGWMEAGWVDLPLVPEFRLQDPIASSLPFTDARQPAIGESAHFRNDGAEIFIVEGSEALATMAENGVLGNQESRQIPSPTSADNLQGSRTKTLDGPSSFFLTVCHYGVDHTGNILFEQVLSASNPGLHMMTSLWQSERSTTDVTNSKNLASGRSLWDDPGISGSIVSRRAPPEPLGAFSSPRNRRRITLLSDARQPIRLLEMTMEGSEGLRRTLVSTATCFYLNPLSRFFNFLTLVTRHLALKCLAFSNGRITNWRQRCCNGAHILGRQTAFGSFCVSFFSERAPV